MTLKRFLLLSVATLLTLLTLPAAYVLVYRVKPAGSGTD